MKTHRTIITNNQTEMIHGIQPHNGENRQRVDPKESMCKKDTFNLITNQATAVGEFRLFCVLYGDNRMLIKKNMKSKHD